MSKEKILIAGGSGLVGQHLANHLFDKGYDIAILSRSKKEHPNFDYYQWDIEKKVIDKAALHVDHIINLTGAGIADKRWTDQRKKILINSRVDSTLLLQQGLKENNRRVKSYTSASAIGIYGDRDAELLTEESPIGQDSFMVQCCKAWEQAAFTLNDYCDRLAVIRIGIVISSKGGALDKFVLPIKLGQANYFGNGKHFYSWIHIEDLSRIFYQCVQNSSFKGVINGVTPSPITNKEFIKECKLAIAKYALVYPIPKFFMKLFLGEMSAVILNSNRVIPEFLNNHKFDFSFKNLSEAVKDVMRRKI